VGPRARGYRAKRKKNPAGWSISTWCDSASCGRNWSSIRSSLTEQGDATTFLGAAASSDDKITLATAFRHQSGSAYTEEG